MDNKKEVIVQKSDVLQRFIKCQWGVDPFFCIEDPEYTFVFAVKENCFIVGDATRNNDEVSFEVIPFTITDNYECDVDKYKNSQKTFVNANSDCCFVNYDVSIQGLMNGLEFDGRYISGILTTEN